MPRAVPVICTIIHALAIVTEGWRHTATVSIKVSREGVVTL